MAYKVTSLGNLMNLLLGTTFMRRCRLQLNRSKHVLNSVVFLFSRSCTLFVTCPYLMLSRKSPDSCSSSGSLFFLCWPMVMHLGKMVNCDICFLVFFHIWKRSTGSGYWATRHALSPLVHPHPAHPPLSCFNILCLCVPKKDWFFCGLPGWKQSVNYCYTGVYAAQQDLWQDYF